MQLFLVWEFIISPIWRFYSLIIRFRGEITSTILAAVPLVGCIVPLLVCVVEETARCRAIGVDDIILLV